MKYIFTFIAGAILSGTVVWQLVESSGERVIELLMAGTEVADLRYFLELQKVPESEIKCKTAKYSVFIASGLDPESSKESPFLGPPGLGPVTAREMTKALNQYESSNVKEYASNCTSQSEVLK